MKFNGANSIFGLLISGFLLLSVACSHTRTASNQLDGLSSEVAAASEVVGETDTAVEPSGVEEEVQATQPVAEAKTADEAAAPQADDFAVPGDEVAVAPVTAEASEQIEASADVPEMVAMVEADLSSVLAPVTAPVTTVLANPAPVKERATKKRARRNVAQSKVSKVLREENKPVPSSTQETKAQLASSDLSQILERNLWWVVSALAIGALWAFFVVRKTRKARMDSSPF